MNLYKQMIDFFQISDNAIGFAAMKSLSELLMELSVLRQTGRHPNLYSPELSGCSFIIQSFISGLF
jgi:hypothetical protein